MLWLLLACTGPGKDSDDVSGDSVSESGDPISITFDARFGDTSFDCGSTVEALGTGNSSFTPTDLRLYVSAFTLHNAAGDQASLSLNQDGLWQYQDLALLDFEDKTGNCSNGTSATNHLVQGTVPAGDWTALSFEVGVPFALNHQDVATAASPLNLSTLFWSWQGGYKFIRLEGKSTGLPTGWLFHLGSTGCTTDGEGQVTEACDNPNRVRVEVADWSPEKTVVLQLSTLLSATNLDSDGGGAPGCMSDPSDPECLTLFGELGIPGGTSSIFAAQ
jgi:uncharacterized repeat protein (TIGR04052 family)